MLEVKGAWGPETIKGQGDSCAHEMVGTPPGKRFIEAVLLHSACRYGRLPGGSTNRHVPTTLEGLQAAF